jgi:hypothetical protein
MERIIKEGQHSSVHKLATLEKDLVEAKMGKIDDLIKIKVVKIIKKLTD